ncbi:MAG: SMC-Scp complex subunit ScpB [Bacteroidetes bacterium]|nr:MAG: SMC-Scp complex subunit ScpB [Bacteroidota bacterium]
MRKTLSEGENDAKKAEVSMPKNAFVAELRSPYLCSLIVSEMHADLSRIIEAIVFASEQPALPAAILEVLQGRREAPEEEEGGAENDEVQPDTYAGLTEGEIKAILESLTQKYQDDAYPFEVRSVAGGYQFFTKPAYYPFIRRAVAQKNRKQLSRAALEVLSIIAYRQPVTKTEVEFIRGVNCDYAIQKLLDRNLIEIMGRSEAPGRPLLYRSSPFFMQYFGLRDLSDLPRLKEFEELAEEHLELFRQQQEQGDTSLNEHGEERPGEEKTVLEGNSGAEGAEA